MNTSEYKRLQKQVQNYKVTCRKVYALVCKKYNWPEDPVTTFKDIWVSWEDLLGGPDPVELKDYTHIFDLVTVSSQILDIVNPVPSRKITVRCKKTSEGIVDRDDVIIWQVYRVYRGQVNRFVKAYAVYRGQVNKDFKAHWRGS